MKDLSQLKEIEILLDEINELQDDLDGLQFFNILNHELIFDYNKLNLDLFNLLYDCQESLQFFRNICKSKILIYLFGFIGSIILALNNSYMVIPILASIIFNLPLKKMAKKIKNDISELKKRYNYLKIQIDKIVDSILNYEKENTDDKYKSNSINDKEKTLKYSLDCSKDINLNNFLIENDNNVKVKRKIK